jgi:N-hydroxyarylamine O-acetyltransferase
LKEEYLKILNVSKRDPSLSFLSELIQEQLRCFPYENISKLANFEERGSRLPTFEEYLEDQKQFGYGGTCYPQNIYFYKLLVQLGFDCSMVQASVNDKPGAHVLIQVMLEDKVYYVDFGFMDGFSGPFEKSTPAEAVFIGRDFKFIPAADDKFSFEIWDEGRIVLKFVEEQHLQDLSNLNSHIKNSFSLDQYFMNNLVIGRRWGSPCYNLVNNTAKFVLENQIQKLKLENIESIEQFLANKMNLPHYQYRKAFELTLSFN